MSASEAGKGDDPRPVGKDWDKKNDRIVGDSCFNLKCKYWTPRRIRLNCSLYNGDVQKIRGCPDRRLQNNA